MKGGLTGFGQLGCIYTAQGFEYDYGGVIIGPDLVWRTEQWVIDHRRSWDRIVKPAEDYGELARHTYKVLLTRGLRGCVIYSTDPETRTLLHTLGVPRLGNGD